LLKSTHLTADVVSNYVLPHTSWYVLTLFITKTIVAAQQVHLKCVHNYEAKNFVSKSDCGSCWPKVMFAEAPSPKVSLETPQVEVKKPQYYL